jgi:hypothetical protein
VCYGYSGAACNAPATAGPADSSGKYGCDIGSQAFSLTSPARFYPDHYEASLAATQACTADGFSYMGQPFSMTSAAAGAMQIKALAAGQTFATAGCRRTPAATPACERVARRRTVWLHRPDPLHLVDPERHRESLSHHHAALQDGCVERLTLGSFTVAPTTYYFDPPKDATTTPDSTWGPTIAERRITVSGCGRRDAHHSRRPVLRAERRHLQSVNGACR